MRKIICIAMALFFLSTIITGIAEAHVHPGQSGSHTIISLLFVTSTLVHIVINRKAFARYFSGKPLKTEQKVPFNIK